MPEQQRSLYWLPIPASDWNEKVSTINSENTDRISQQLIRLSHHDLNERQLLKLRRVLRKTPEEALTSLTKANIHIVGNITLDHLTSPIEASALRWGLNLKITTTSYGQAQQELLSEDSSAFSPDINIYVIYASPLDTLFSTSGGIDSPFDGEKAAADVINYYKFCLDRIKKINPKAHCILATMPAPRNRYFGSMERSFGDTKAAAIETINNFIHTSGHQILDIAFLANLVGLQNWYSNKYYDLAKYPFSPIILPQFCDYFARSIAVTYGKSKKCLVVDLDNTMWGGVIGDDGVNNIEIGHETARGQSFLRIQETVLNLKKRGIILAVCSKNDIENGRLPFEQNKNMLLKKEDFSVFVCNWEDKASNLKAIAKAVKHWNR